MSGELVEVVGGGPAEPRRVEQELARFAEGQTPQGILNQIPGEYRASVYERLRGPVTALVIWGRSWIPIPDSLLERLGGVERVLEILQRLPEEVRRALRQRVVNVDHDPNPRVR